jgi:hypothetical protein
MTLAELEASLPNGFHDAYFHSVTIDYRRRTVTIAASILVGVPDDPPGECDRLRQAVVIFEGLQFMAMEPPERGHVLKHGDRLWVDYFISKSPPAASKEIPADCFVGSFFVQDWGSNIHVAARSVSLEWTSQ